MKNSRYYPFERNHYFYGKLLTVRDFDSEQKYMNDKRRLMNRLLHGVGVVAGLQVVKVDDKSITVEMGVALDGLGREIVVPTPVTLKLSTIDGFMNNEYAKNVFLCIAFDEKGKEPVHAVANSAVRQEDVSEYNRIFESYRLFIQEEAPDPTHFGYTDLFESSTLLYDDGQVRIFQKTPRFVNPGEIFEMSLVVEKTLQTPRVTFSYELQSDFFELVQSPTDSKIKFQEPDGTPQTRYEMVYLLKAQKTLESRGRIYLKKDSVHLQIGEKQKEILTDGQAIIELVEKPVKEQILEQFFQRTLDQALEYHSETPYVVLAKISLLQMGSTYIIDQVESLPFGEYVYNPTMLKELDKYTQKATGKKFLAKSSTEILPPNASPKFEVDYHEDQREFQFRLGLPQMKNTEEFANTGVLDFKLDNKTKAGRTIFSKATNSYFSEEIEHGLGIGNVCIVLAIEEESDNTISELLDYGEQVYFGDYEVFKGSEYEAAAKQISLGTLVYPQKGTFRIGVKQSEPFDLQKVRIRWWAIKQSVTEQAKEQTAFKQVAPSKE